MTHDEAKAAIEDVIDDIVHIAQMPAQVPKGAALFIAKGKLAYILEEWPPTDPKPQ